MKFILTSLFVAAVAVAGDSPTTTVVPSTPTPTMTKPVRPTCARCPDSCILVRPGPNLYYICYSLGSQMCKMSCHNGQPGGPCLELCYNNTVRTPAPTPTPTPTVTDEPTDDCDPTDDDDEPSDDEPTDGDDEPTDDN
ncbi:Aste57867_9827 [Aphanomyces stellatus]|uniref:Aste57867_9827 protein n=1 Tax=Aphanomyces stellatus TaxID=120398 RepID=A0A485KP45_9STRA|nr:hypothetical protein As57867_009788 [Aphanomyces stellatus]VFT86706.1 Aste57867_9827 [Aphanomyces stellatus]